MGGLFSGIGLRGGLWIALAVAAALVAALMAHAGLGFAGGRNRMLLLAAAAGLTLLRRPGWRSGAVRAVETLELLALFGGIALLGALASYSVAAGTEGFVDAQLAAADRALGFDWLALYRIVSASPMLMSLSQASYFSMFLSPTLLLIGLGAQGEAMHARRFLAAYGLALAITIAMFGWFPSVSAGNYYLGVEAADGVLPGAHFLDVFDALRAGTYRIVPLADLRGLITFPSFHAASAVLFIWGAWPLRLLRWPMLAMNLAMIAATPIQGSHYLVDVIGGVLVASLAIAAMRRVAQPSAATLSTTLPTWSPASR